MKKRIFRNIFLFFFLLLVLLIVGETTIRIIGEYDFDGNFHFGKRTLRPYRLPLNTAQKNINQYLKEKNSARVVYDSLLGWTNASNHRSADGMYVYNSLGIRVPSSKIEFNYPKPTDTLRILLLGDSFTHGEEVGYENTWAAKLEVNLNKSGMPTQVINLGVGGYGMDQAFLRWKKLGKLFNPDVVIFGLQMENVRRNVNLMRSVYTPTANIVFSKPRYILDGDDLEIINMPTVPPEQVPGVLADFEKWELSSYEYFYNSADYQPSLFLKSKFISFIRESIDPDKSLILRHPYGTRSGVYPLNEEPANITLEILESLKKDVNKNGADLLLVHLPHIWGLGYYRKYGTLPYLELLEKINADFELLDTKESFENNFEKYKNDDFYLWFHYSPLGNEIVADAIADYILNKSK